jgi:hypothetical protein
MTEDEGDIFVTKESIQEEDFIKKDVVYKGMENNEKVESIGENKDISKETKDDIINYAEGVQENKEILTDSSNIEVCCRAQKVERDNFIKKNMKTNKERNYTSDGWFMHQLDMSILLLRSSQWAFIICLAGVTGQAFHLYHVISYMSDLNGTARVVNSLLWAAFFSFGLIFFALKQGSLKPDETSRIRKYRRVVNWFIALDAFSNLFYWYYRLVLSPAVLGKYIVDGEVVWANVDWMTFDIHRIQWPQAIAATVFSIAIPFILKSFAGEIKIPKFLDYMFRQYTAKEKSNNGTY